MLDLSIDQRNFRDWLIYFSIFAVLGLDGCIFFGSIYMLYFLWRGSRGVTVEQTTEIVRRVVPREPRRLQIGKVLLQWLAILGLIVLGGKAVLLGVSALVDSASWRAVISIVVFLLVMEFAKGAYYYLQGEFTLKTLVSLEVHFIWVLVILEISTPFVEFIDPYKVVAPIILLYWLLVHRLLIIVMTWALDGARYRLAFALMEMSEVLPLLGMDEYVRGTLAWTVSDHVVAEEKLVSFLNGSRTLKASSLALHNLGRARLGLGDYEGAQEALQGAIELEPKRGEHKSALAEVYLMGRSGSPIELTEAAVQTIQDQRYAGEVWATHAWALAAAGSLEQARAAIQKALENLPTRFKVNMAAAHYKLGRAWEALNNQDAAHTHFQLALHYSSTSGNRFGTSSVNAPVSGL